MIHVVILLIRMYDVGLSAFGAEAQFLDALASLDFILVNESVGES